MVRGDDGVSEGGRWCSDASVSVVLGEVVTGSSPRRQGVKASSS